MSNHEYHQLLKFLYFEGYADSYEDADYILEDMSNIERKQLMMEATRMRKYFNKKYGNENEEGRTPSRSEAAAQEAITRRKISRNRTAYSHPPIRGSSRHLQLARQGAKSQQESYEVLLDYLLDEGYTNTVDGALTIIENMSENWMESVLISELNRQAKEEGKGKTPLYVGTHKGYGRVVKDNSGKQKVERNIRPIMHPSASIGRMKQGMDIPDSHRGTSTGMYTRHPHGGTSMGRGEIGSKRGVKKQRGAPEGTKILTTPEGKRKVVVGAKKPQTPVDKFKAEKQRNKDKETSTPHNKYFSHYNQPMPTRLDTLRARRAKRQSQQESYEVLLDYLLDEGYTNTVDGAVTIIENMSDDWLESILNSY